MRIDTGALEPRQRFFQRRQRRLSVRLEGEFWEQLEACAGDESISLTDLVFDIASQIDGAGNRSSALRTYCVRWLRRELMKARLAASSTDVQALLTACPMPCVVLTPDKKIAAHNQSFSEGILQPIVQAAITRGEEASVRLNISRPLDRIVREALASRRGYAEASVAFVSGGNLVQMTGRFCLLNRRAAESSPVLCYLRAR